MFPYVLAGGTLLGAAAVAWYARRRGGGRRMLTKEALIATVPRLAGRPGLEVEAIRSGLDAAMAEAKATTPRQRAAFLAQLAHESGGFRYLTELADGSRYEGRRDLGNTMPGDGPRYRGRGWIQLTGRANYRAAGAALGLPLEATPDLAARPDVAGRVAAWYWTSRGLNPMAEAGDFDGITRRINGGMNGAEDRRAYYARALTAGV